MINSHIDSKADGAEEKAVSLDFAGSPLASVGMQARNFTAAVPRIESNIAPVFYSSDSLTADIDRLSDPGFRPGAEQFLNVAVKYFFAYVHDGAHEEKVPYGDISELYEQFSRHLSLNEPDDDIELMNRLRMWSPVLRVLADAPRAAHVLRTVLFQKNIEPTVTGSYLGVDIGAGTGVMLLAQQLQARRNGFADIQTLGFQADPISGERTHDLIHTLGGGSVMLADSGRIGAYGVLRGRNINYVANEMVAGIQQSLTKDNFFQKYKAFFAAVEGSADHAYFFPEGIIAHSGIEGTSVILSKENEFQVPPEYLGSDFIPQGLILDGKVLPMHRLGKGFYRFLT